MTVPQSPVVPRAAWRVPLCLPRGDTEKVSVFLARRGCPPVAAAAPAPAPARPVGAHVAQLSLGGSRWLPAVGQPSDGTGLSEHCCPPHQSPATGYPTPSSLCPHPLHTPLPAAATLEVPTAAWGPQCQHLPLALCPSVDLPESLWASQPADSLPAGAPSIVSMPGLAHH